MFGRIVLENHKIISVGAWEIEVGIILCIFLVWNGVMWRNWIRSESGGFRDVLTSQRLENGDCRQSRSVGQRQLCRLATASRLAEVAAPECGKPDDGVREIEQAIGEQSRSCRVAIAAAKHATGRDGGETRDGSSVEAATNPSRQEGTVNRGDCRHERAAATSTGDAGLRQGQRSERSTRRAMQTRGDQRRRGFKRRTTQRQTSTGNEQRWRQRGRRADNAATANSAARESAGAAWADGRHTKKSGRATSERLQRRGEFKRQQRRSNIDEGSKTRQSTRRRSGDEGATASCEADAATKATQQPERSSDDSAGLHRHCSGTGIQTTEADYAKQCRRRARRAENQGEQDDGHTCSVAIATSPVPRHGDITESGQSDITEGDSPPSLVQILSFVINLVRFGSH